jgi:mono/diheme cytochrome c family protein
VIAVVAMALAALVAQAGLPEGAGATIVKTRCLICHDADLIVSQRLSRPGWTREIDKMVRWGAQVPDAEREALTAYLSAHFTPSPRTVQATAGSGERVFAAACLVCHQADLVDQQRLSRAGWVREVDKMIRWGAPVPAADKDALVDYLTTKATAR